MEVAGKLAFASVSGIIIDTFGLQVKRANICVKWLLSWSFLGDPPVACSSGFSHSITCPKANWDWNYLRSKEAVIATYKCDIVFSCDRKFLNYQHFRVLGGSTEDGTPHSPPIHSPGLRLHFQPSYDLQELQLGDSACRQKKEWQAWCSQGQEWNHHWKEEAGCLLPQGSFLF